MPGLISIPFIVSSIKLESNEWQLYLVISYGGSIFCFALLLQLFAACFKNRAAINAVSRLDTNNDIPTNTGNLKNCTCVRSSSRICRNEKKLSRLLVSIECLFISTIIKNISWEWIECTEHKMFWVSLLYVCL